MSDDYLVRYCAPTLAGIKTGSIFSCSYESKDTLLGAVRKLNERLAKRGLCVLPLHLSERRAMIYLFRPECLSRDLSDATAKETLVRCGYDVDSGEKCIAQLVKRLRFQKEFPHEIGLFLGYPPEDVKGFIENKACNCKFAGCWKVYGDEETAKKKFAQYRKCTRLYWAQWAKGKDIERLAVATRT